MPSNHKKGGSGNNFSENSNREAFALGHDRVTGTSHFKQFFKKTGQNKSKKGNNRDQSRRIWNRKQINNRKNQWFEIIKISKPLDILIREKIIQKWLISEMGEKKGITTDFTDIKKIKSEYY